MAPRRTFLERPYTSLVGATKAHAAVVAGEPHPSEQAPAEETAQEHKPARPRRRQGHDPKGRFTA